MDPAHHRMEELLARGRAQGSLTSGESAELCREAIAAAREIEGGRAASQTLCALAREFMKFGRTVEAGLAVEAALARYEPPEPEEWQGGAMAILGAVRRHHGQHAEAAELAREVMRISRQVGSPVLEATAYNNLALAQHSMGQGENALSNYLEALALLEPMDTAESRRLRLFMHANVADLHTEVCDYHRAAECYGSSLVLIESLDMPVHKLRLGRMRGVCLRKAGRLDEARALLEGLQTLLDIPGPSGTASELVRADLARLQGDAAAAARHYRRAMEREASQISARGLSRLQLDLASTLPPDDDEAFALASSVWRFAQEQESSGGLCCEALELLSLQHEAQGDLASALRRAREATKLRQALFERARQREQGELQARFDLAQRSWEARWHRTQAEELTRRVEERTRELETARDRAQAADRMKVGFLAAASHELRTPLNAIIGYGELIREELGMAEPEELAEPTERLLESAERLLQLVDRILQMTNLEAGATRPSPRPVPLAPLLDEVISSVKRRSSKGNTLSWSCPSDLGAAWTDGTLLRSVLFNLVENAEKFTSEGRIEASARRVGETLILSVEDTGIGMSPEEIVRLFQLFTQIESGFTRRFGGLGLGLALGRRYCQLLGGDLTVRSEAGQGSIFEIHIPFEVRPRDDREGADGL